MDNPDTQTTLVVTRYTTMTNKIKKHSTESLNGEQYSTGVKRLRKPKEQHKIDNPETVRRQTKHNTSSSKGEQHEGEPRCS